MLKYLATATAFSAAAIIGGAAQAGCDLIICDGEECEICTLNPKTEDLYNCTMHMQLEAELMCGVDLVPMLPQLTTPQVPQVVEFVRPDLRIVLPQTSGAPTR